MSNTFIQDYLANKDQDYSEYIPKQYRVSADEKKFFLIKEGLESKYLTSQSTACTKSCWKDLDSPVVSAAEANCMTNCTAKRLEVLSLFHLMPKGM